MATLRGELEQWLGSAPERLNELKSDARVEQIGRVQRLGDGVASISGLGGARLNELLNFEDGSIGLALHIDEELVDCMLLHGAAGTVSGMRVRSSGNAARVPVGPGLLGRVVDPLGNPLDGGEPPQAERYEPIERPAPGILDRAQITQPLMTGVTVIDAMIPLGRGQRELLIGDRKTGKTAVAVDTVINQKRSDVVCVYAVIGQKASMVEHVIDAVRKYGALDRCIFVVAEASALPGAQWIAPYAACTMAEYFRDKGQHALLILDDLSKHAIVHREISLLLRRPPGREAYPGDIFYVHSRLLERAAKLSEARGGGSLTALPIAETQSGNLTAYVPTNLISITDGQIYFEPKLFYEGQKPAVNVGLSVSRVGGKTQIPAIKELAGRLKLDYAQFLELEVFTRFGAIVDERTKARIQHGRAIRAILTQPQYRPLSAGEVAALLLATKENKLDALPVERIEKLKAGLGDWLTNMSPAIKAKLEDSGTLDATEREALLSSLDTYISRLGGPLHSEA